MSEYIKAIEEKSDKIWEVAYKMWQHPETAYEEVNAAKWNAEFLRSEGFEVTENYLGIPTAVMGVWGSGHPVVGFLGELDALPGLSQTQSPFIEAACPGGPGHGCGHNLMAGASLAGAIGFKAELEKRGIPGTVVYYGCPAEEVITGKVFMAREGAFRELDAAFSWHGHERNQASYGRMNAMNNAIFHFHGRTSHAGCSPETGRSALDAVELMNIGCQFLREHVTMDTRIHYVITNGGTAPNVVPDESSVWYFVRAMERDSVVDTYNRLVRIAGGAAMMTDTTYDIEFLGGSYNTMENHVLADLLNECLHEIGAPEYTEEELKLADTLNRQSPNFDKLAPGASPINLGVSPINRADVFGSTDVAEVQHICPAAQINTATYNAAAMGHSWQITLCSGNSIGRKGMFYGGKVMALAATRLALEPELVRAAKAEFDASMNGRSYVCPIPADIKMPGQK